VNGDYGLTAVLPFPFTVRQSPTQRPLGGGFLRTMGKELNNQANQLRLVGSFATQSGYSHMARGILRAGVLAGYELQAVESDLRLRIDVETDGRVQYQSHVPIPAIPLHDLEEADLRTCQRVHLPASAPTILMQSPWNLNRWPQYGNGPVMSLTMTESDNLCHDWNHGIRCTDYALAPSQHVLDVFRARVPEVPSDILPLCVDERLWSPDEYVEGINGQPKFLFFSIFNVSERKNWRTLLAAFTEEFAGEHKEVGLLIKASGMTAEIVDIAGWCQQAGAWVHVDASRYTDWIIGSLYRNCNVYVQCSPEGFGLPYVEAALCGKPSIALAGGGAVDVVTEETGYLVPTVQKSIVCHMPHYYRRPRFDGDPDGHLFHMCEIDELRKVLRRAYEEETAGSEKGKAARQRALQKFTPGAVAPILRDRVAQCVETAALMEWARMQPDIPTWATCAGAWGDVMCCIGYIRAMMQTKEIEKIGLIFFGRDRRIAEWLWLQPWVREVVEIIEPDQKAMTKTYGYLCQSKPWHGRRKFMELIEGVGRLDIREDQIAFTQLCLAEQQEPVHWHGAVLPDKAKEWAGNVCSVIEGPFILLNPLSIASNEMRDHWRYWSHAITWILENSIIPVVMVGESLIEWPAHTRLVNVSGASRSMMDVLALAERAAGIVTTSNNLAHYSVIARKPCVCVAARTYGRDSYYHKWNDVDTLTFVDFDCPMGDFVWACSERIGEYIAKPKEDSDEKDQITEADFYGLGRA
jgi:glycosyltransferase involved in cell wall biosynthesis